MNIKIAESGTFKIKISVHQKIPLKVKRHHRLGENTWKALKNGIRWEPVIYKEYINKWFKKEIQIANKHKEKVLNLKETEIEITIKYHFTLRIKKLSTLAIPRSMGIIMQFFLGV